MTFSQISYLIGSVCFILSLQGLSSAKTAKSGNYLGIIGMLITVITTILQPEISNYHLILIALGLGGVIGMVIAQKIPMTALPQLVAAFHSLVGLAAVCIATAVFVAPHLFNVGLPGDIYPASLLEMGLGSAIGAITFSGSVIAFAKLQGIMSGKPLIFPQQHKLNALIAASILVMIGGFIYCGSGWLLALFTSLAFALGFLLILPIGGADMPVVVSMLNSYSGWAATGIGLTLDNNLLIITGALVGASGAILSYIMCKGMNRSILNVILGGVGSDPTAAATSSTSNANADKPIKAGSPEDAAFILRNSHSVIIVPGYGMAVAQAQHSLREMGDILKSHGVTVRYAIHPVAGRMPGHMNVLLAEASVPYEDVLELEEINHDFGSTDTVYVIGANDVTNPAARTDPTSPIYGMPILDVEKAGTVLFVKRSMSPGYSGVENELFYRQNTMMLFGDAKKVTETIVKELNAI